MINCRETDNFFELTSYYTVSGFQLSKTYELCRTKKICKGPKKLTTTTNKSAVFSKLVQPHRNKRLPASKETTEKYVRMRLTDELNEL